MNKSGQQLLVIPLYYKYIEYQEILNFYIFLEFQRPVPKKSMSTTSNTNENKVKLKEPLKSSDKPETTKKRNFEELFENTDSTSKLVEFPSLISNLS